MVNIKLLLAVAGIFLKELMYGTVQVQGDVQMHSRHILIKSCAYLEQFSNVSQ